MPVLKPCLAGLPSAAGGVLFAAVALLFLARAVAAGGFDMADFPVRTVEESTFRFDPTSGQVLHADGRREPYFLVVDGLVEAPQRIAYAELRAMPQRRLVADFHCVEGWSINDVPWSGVSFADLFARARPTAAAKFAVFHALGHTRSRPGGLDHYVESFPLSELLDPRLSYLLALDLEGRPLPQAQGAPARVVCPFDLAYKSIKFVYRIELAARPAPGWWTRANPIYPTVAPVQPGRLRQPDPRRGGK